MIAAWWWWLGLVGLVLSVGSVFLLLAIALRAPVRDENGELYESRRIAP